MNILPKNTTGLNFRMSKKCSLDIIFVSLHLFIHLCILLRPYEFRFLGHDKNFASRIKERKSLRSVYI